MGSQARSRSLKEYEAGVRRSTKLDYGEPDPTNGRAATAQQQVIMSLLGDHRIPLSPTEGC